jgi:hypothetical protein
MVDTLGAHRGLGNWVGLVLTQIQFLDYLRQKDHFHQAVTFTWAYAHRQSVEGAADSPKSSPVADLALFIHSSDFYPRVIFDRRQIPGIAALAGMIPSHRSFHLESFMRSLRIINRTPFIECLLHMCAIAPTAPNQHLRFQGAMKAFFFPLCLGMIRSAMVNPDAQAHQPNIQRRAFASCAAPRPAIIPQNTFRQTIDSKCIDQMILGRGLLLIGAGRQKHIIARVVVQRTQGMATSLIQSKMAFEIHLPQLIRRRTLKPLERHRRLALLRPDQSMTMDNTVNRAGRWKRLVPQILHPTTQFACTPRWMPTAQVHNLFLKGRIRSARTFVRTARMILKAFGTIPPEAPQPLITNRGANTKAPAQLPHIDVGLKSQAHKFKSYMNQVFHRPRHRTDTLPLPASMCPPCPRTPVHYVPGLYTGEGRGEVERQINC